MATAERAGGLYYIGDTAVDAFGVAIPNAPAKQKDTDPSLQPGSPGNIIANDPIHRLAQLLAPVVGPAGHITGVVGVTGNEAKHVLEHDDDALPTLAELPEHLAAFTTVKEVKALQKQDPRVGAVKLYEARIAELEK